jgi:hypothetical protein
VALILVKTHDGKEVLMHTSALDSHRPPRANGLWRDVWAMVDAHPRVTAAHHLEETAHR